jgi:hypothetical protein
MARQPRTSARLATQKEGEATPAERVSDQAHGPAVKLDQPVPRFPLWVTKRGFPKEKGALARNRDLLNEDS